MALNLGATAISTLRLGTATPSKVMLGETEVWPLLPEGDPWTPDMLPNLVMFTSFDDLSKVTLVDGRVSQVEDANGIPFVQANAANQPLFTNGGADKYAVTFNTNFLNSTVTHPVTSSASLFMLYSISGDAEAMGTVNEQGTHGQLGAMGGQGAVWNFAGRGNRVFRTGMGGIALVVLNFAPGNTGNGRAWGVPITSDTGGFIGDINNIAGWSYGKPNWNPGGAPLSLRCFGRVAGLLSGEDTERFEGWAAHTFGMAVRLPADHPYRNGPPLAPAP